MTTVQETEAGVSTAGVPTMTLADIRRRAGKSQEQVAEAMGVGQPRVAQIEEQFPDVMYPVALRYFQALGGRVQFALPGGTVQAAAIGQDPARAQALERRRNRTRGDAGRFG